MSLLGDIVTLIRGGRAGAPAAVKQHDLLQENLGAGGGFGVGRDAPKMGTAELLRAYGEMPWLRACVHKVAASVATVEWRAFVMRDESGSAVRSRKLQRAGMYDRHRMIAALQKQGRLEELEDHEVVDLIAEGSSTPGQQPNLEGATFWRLTQSHLDLAGEAFWWKSRDGRGLPATLWPLLPTQIKDVPKPGQEQPAFIVSASGGAEHSIPASELVWFRDPDPAKPYGRGIGAARSLSTELDTDAFAAQYVRSFFYNDARPPFIASFKGLSAPELRKFKREFEQQHRGVFRRWLAHFTNAEINIHEFRRSLRDLEMTPLRKLERDTVIQVYGLPPELFGIVESSNRATAHAAKFLFAAWVLVPRLDLLRSVLQVRLVPEFDDRIVLDFVSPVPEDAEHIRELAKVAPWARNVDEWRAALGEEELGEENGGGAHLVPVGLVARETPGGAPISSGPAPTPGEQGSGDDEPVGPKAAAAGPRRQVQVRFLEDEGDMAAVLAAVAPDILLNAILPTAEQTAAAFGAGLFEELDADGEFDPTTSQMSDFLAGELSDTFRAVNDTTQRRLRDELEEGIAVGETAEEIEERAELFFVNQAESRVGLLARDGSVQAANFGVLEAMRQASVPMKEWLSMRDERVRPTHVTLDGTVIPEGELFVSPSGAQAPGPHLFGVPAEDANCRCTVIPIVAGELSYLSDEESRSARWKTFEADRAPWEEQLANVLGFAFEEQKERVLAALRALGGG